MILSNIRSLWDVPGLDRIRKTCSKHGIHFTAFGSVVRRLARTGFAAPNALIDLFDLVPFASDIDLIHTGDPELTPNLLESLIRDVPFGECFRWQLRSVHSNGKFWESTKVNNIIPSALITLSSNSTHGFHDRWQGMRDIQTHSYRYIRNGFYSESPLFRQGRDIEFFSVLLYYRILLESISDISDLEKQPGLNDARLVIADTCSSTETLTRLEESSYLRARLRYLMASIASSTSPMVLENFMDVLALKQLCDYLRVTVSGYDDLFPEDTLTVTAHLGGDTFRLEFDTPRWLSSAEAVSEMEEALSAVAALNWGDRASGASLGPGQRVLMASSMFEVNEGISDSSHAGPTFVHEFVHFAVPIDSSSEALLANFRDDDLSVIAALRGTISSVAATIFVSPPSAVHLEPPGISLVNRRLFIRVNCGGLFERIDAIRSELGSDRFGFQFFLIGLERGR